MDGSDLPQWHIAAALVPLGSSAIAVTLGYLSLTRRTDHPREITSLIAIPVLIALRHVRDILPSPDFNSFYAFATLMWLTNICYLHCCLSITRLLPERDGDRNWLLAWRLLFNLRVTQATAADLCRLAARHKDDRPSPAATATTPARDRYAFIGRRVLSILGKYLVLCLLYYPLLDPSKMAPGDAEWRPSDFAPDRQIVFRHAIYLAAHQLRFPLCSSKADIDTIAIMRGIIIRVQFLVQPIIYDICSLGAFHDIFAAVAVGIGLDTPEEWPPLFRNIQDAYTVCRFRSCFWQGLISNSFSAFAGSFLARGLHFQRGVLFVRYAKNALVFVLSGLMHGIFLHSIHPGCPAGGAVLFFSMQVGAIFVEDMVCMLWRAMV